MGNQHCLPLEVQTLKKCPAYGQHECIISNHQQYALVYKSIETSRANKQSLIEQLEKRKKIKSVHLSNLPLTTVSLCSYQVTELKGIIELKMQYELVTLTLADKAHLWKTTNKQISEAEISNILIGVQHALQELYQMGIGHRCINLQTILCCNTLYKLTDISMTTFLTGYDLALQGDQNQLLSNHLLNYLHYQGTEPHYTIDDDLFSLGMAAIAIIINAQPADMYFVDQCDFKKVNHKKINEGLKAIDRLYNPWIGKKVRQFLENGLKDPLESTKESSSIRKGKSFT